MSDPHPTDRSPLENSEGKAIKVAERWYFKLTILAVVLGITIALFLLRDRVEDLESLGYLGAFVATLASSATIFVPVPGIIVVFILGDVWNPLILGVVSGVGMALGELTGYVAGYTGKELFQDTRMYHRIARWMKRRGDMLIFLFALIPNPLFDMVGIAAGALRYRVERFLFFCLMGKVPRCILVAYAGRWGLEWVRDWFAS